MGNSIIGGAIKKPERRFTGTLNSSKLEADFYASTDNSAAQTVNTGTSSELARIDSEVSKQTAVNLSRVAAVQQAARDAESDAASASRQAAGVRQANDFVAGVQQNEVAIRNLVATTNQNRANEAAKREQFNQARNNRFAIGAREVQAGFDAIGGRGRDVGAEYALQTAGYAEFRQGQRDALKERLGSFPKPRLSEALNDLATNDTGIRAIETEFNVFGGLASFNFGIGASFTVDSNGSFVLAGSGFKALDSSLQGFVGIEAVQIKGFNTSAIELGTGEAFSVVTDVTLGEALLRKPLDKFIKRPVDFFAGQEVGFTIKDDSS